MLKVLLLCLLTLSCHAKITLVSVYDAETLKHIINTFTADTGIEVEVKQAKGDKLLKLAMEEGGDLFFDKDIVYLNRAVRAGIFQAMNPTDYVTPKKFFAKDNQWAMLFYRSRTLIYNKDLVSAGSLQSYFDLGAKRFEGKVCMREGKSTYNIAWASFMLTHYPEDKVVSLLKDISKNAIRPLFTSDRDIIRAVAERKCEVGLVNSYYLPKFIEEDSTFPVKITFVEQNGAGAHINGLGMGLLKSSKNKAEAIKFIQHMASSSIQSYVGKTFKQYPTNPEAKWSRTLEDFGTFDIDTTTLSDTNNLHEKALKLMSENGL